MSRNVLKVDLTEELLYVITQLFSVDQRNETVFREWPPKPEPEPQEDPTIYQRDPRLFPIRTPQPPRRPPMHNSSINLDMDEGGEFHR